MKGSLLLIRDSLFIAEGKQISLVLQFGKIVTSTNTLLSDKDVRERGDSGHFGQLSPLSGGQFHFITLNKVKGNLEISQDGFCSVTIGAVRLREHEDFSFLRDLGKVCWQGVGLHGG